MSKCPHSRAALHIESAELQFAFRCDSESANTNSRPDPQHSVMPRATTSWSCAAGPTRTSRVSTQLHNSNTSPIQPWSTKPSSHVLEPRLSAPFSCCAGFCFPASRNFAVLTWAMCVAADKGRSLDSPNSLRRVTLLLRRPTCH